MNTGGYEGVEAGNIDYAEKLVKADKIAEKIKQLTASGQLYQIEELKKGVDSSIISLVNLML